MRFPISWRWRQDRNGRLRSGSASGGSRRPIARLQVEGLESRRLLSVTVNEFPTPTTPSGPLGITTGPDGNLWFAETNGNPNHIGQLDPTTHVVTEFATPTASSFPQFLAAGPDGNLWFTEGEGHNIGEINPTTHAIAEFPLAAGSDPFDIAAGPDGNLWFTEADGNKIGQINPTTHAIAEFPVPTAGSEPLGIAVGPDGNLWFTEFIGNKIGEINPTTHAIAEFPAPTANGGLTGIAAGPDGNLWFTEADGNKIGQINPTTHAIAEFPIPSTGGGGSNPWGIAAGSDGNLWFTLIQGHSLGEINPTTHTIAQFPSPGEGEGGITTGPDGNIWFGGQDNNFIGQAVLTDVALSGQAPASVSLGSNVTYTLTVTNDDTKDVTGVTLTDTLPAGVTFVSATGGVTPVGGVLTFALGGLVAGASTSVTIVVTPTAAGSLSDTATVRMDQADPTPADNSVTLPTSVTSSTSTAPDLALSGSAPTSVAPGSSVTYSLTVTDDGTAGATGVTLTDTLPAGVTFASATGGAQPVKGVLTVPIGSLAAGASAGVTIVVTPTAAGTLTDGATVAMSQTDPTPGDNSVTLLTTVTTPNVPNNSSPVSELTLSADAPGSVTLGNNVTYTLTVTNGGPADATGVTLTDTLPAGATFVSATGGVRPVDGVLTFAIGNLAAGASTSVTIVVTPTAAGTLTDQARVGGNQADPAPANESITRLTTVSPAGPAVTSVHRFGFHARPTRLVLTFDEPLDPARAQDPGNYRIVPLGGPPRRIRVKTAVYDAATRTVTLSPVHRLNLHRLFRLTVVGTGPSGVADASGNLLDGPNTGDPGADDVTIVSAADLVLRTTNPAILGAYKKIVANQAAYLRAAGSDRGAASPDRLPG